MANEVYDQLGSFPRGMNSGVDPLILERTQLSFAINATMRGDFFVQRPGFSILNVNYSDVPTGNNFQTGIFQGAGYYKPDSGSESIALQIGGRQFLATPDNDGNVSIMDISIPMDLDSPNQPQAWIEQAENFLIFNDGINLPLIYDGSFTRRSFGPSQVLGTVNFAAVAPQTGQTVLLTLAAPYTGPVNQTIYVGSAIYEVTQVGGQTAVYSESLRNIDDPVVAHLAGETLVSNPSRMGIVKFIDQNSCEFDPFFVPSYVAVNGQISFSFSGTTLTSPITVRIRSINRTVSKTVINFGPNIAISKLQGTKVEAQYLTFTPPTVPIGTLLSGFTTPVVGGTAQAQMSSQVNVPTTGTAVWIGDSQYVLSNAKIITPPADAAITVRNITDTPTAAISIGTVLSTLPEIPAGRMLAYGMGRVWESMTDGISFLATDIVNGASGSTIYNGRDAVLKVVENSFLNGGGLFRVPGTIGEIRAMKFCALLDVSLGQGPLQVFCPNSVFACQAPVDRTTWKNLTNPILVQSLIGAGGVGQNSVSLANGDIIFRSSDGAIRSLLMARLDFNRWSNTPVSREMARLLEQEDNTLLAFSTSTVFDNRFLMGTGLTQSGRGVYSTSLVALNFDPISSLQGTDQSIYDGQWTGLNVLQLVSGYFNGMSRCFAICLSEDLSHIEIVEILPSDGPTAVDFDDGIVPVTAEFEGPVIDFGDRRSQQHNYHRLNYGEIYVDEMVGDVQFQAFYKPDQWPTWVPWHSWTQKFVPPTDPGFRPRVGLPCPDGTVFDKVNNRPLREAFTYQFRLVMTGKARFLGARFAAEIIPQPKNLSPVPSKTT